MGPSFISEHLSQESSPMDINWLEALSRGLSLIVTKMNVSNRNKKCFDLRQNTKIRRRNLAPNLLLIKEIQGKIFET